MSAEFVEQLHLERDLGRATWQRSVGAVVMRQLTEAAFSERTELSEETLMGCERWARSRDANHLEPVWARAYAVSHETLDGSVKRYERPRLEVPQSLRAQISKYTFGADIETVLNEGVRTQARFPIALAKSISDYGEPLGIDSFKITNLRDVAAIFRQPYFQEMVDMALVTANGFWRTFSTDTYVSLTRSMPGMDYFTFMRDQTVRFSPAMVRAMRQYIQGVNREGDSSDSIVELQSSSGCPARHRRASFNTEEDMTNLEMLSVYFGEPQEELLQSFDESIVQKGLTLVASSLEATSDWFSEINGVHIDIHTDDE